MAFCDKYSYYTNFIRKCKSRLNFNMNTETVLIFSYIGVMRREERGDTDPSKCLFWVVP